MTWKDKNDVEELVGGYIPESVSYREAVVKPMPFKKMIEVLPVESERLPEPSNVFNMNFSGNYISEHDLYFDNIEDAPLDEKFVKRVIKRNTTGKGAVHDNPHTARAIMESLQSHPEILGIYLDSRVR